MLDGCLSSYMQTRSYISVCSAVRPAFDYGPYPCEFPKGTVSRKKGSATNVRYWQEFLFWYGYTEIEIDGIFGDQSEKLMKKFQKAQEIEETGVCDKVKLQTL